MCNREKLLPLNKFNIRTDHNNQLNYRLVFLSVFGSQYTKNNCKLMKFLQLSFLLPLNVFILLYLKNINRQFLPHEHLAEHTIFLKSALRINESEYN